jgi:RNA polymerase sigma factor (sigma-70 family)
MASVAHGLVPPIQTATERSSVSRSASAPAPAVDEARLAQRAATGDGDAFAELYGRYEQRVYNLCYRILGTQDDAADATQEAFVSVFKRLPKLQGRDLAFGSYVFTSARNACYDLIDRRRRAEPSDQIPESSIPVGGGVGGGGVGFDPGDPEDDPERRLLLAAGQEEIRAANATLPERQREVLALRELEELSYDEIAEIMDLNRNSVAQLISRARISLRDALRGTAVASIATSSPDCERAVALLAAKQDRQRAAEGDWLADHLIACETCRLSREAMEEAGVSYRAWLPIAAAPLLFRETMAAAAEAAGEDWSDVIERREAAGGAGASAGGVLGALASVFRRRRRAMALIGVIALLLVVVVFAGATGDGPPTDDPVPVAEEAPAAPAAKPEQPKREAEKPNEPKQKGGGDEQSPAAAGDPAEPAAEDEQPADEPDSPSGPPDAPSVVDAPPERTDRGAGRPRRGGRENSGSGERTEAPPGDPAAPTPEQPPTEQPPSDQPPTEQPPTEQPPSDQPPRDQRPTEPSPSDQPPRDQPPSQTPACRDAAGIPIPCPPSRPQQPPPRLAPPPRQP